MRMKHGWKLVVLVLAVFAAAANSVVAGQPPSRPLPAASAAKLPRWRGFNLPYRMRKEFGPGPLNQPYTEDKIRLVAELGFNFVRLPVDYRYWIKDDNWAKIDGASPVLAEIDNVVDWGRKYGVHVSINFHTAPGYCINDKTPEGSRLWEDPEAQRVCAMHWAYFARRYKGIPNDRLSFNLWNEPSRTGAETHLRVTRKVVAAIRAEDADRLIICDGFMFKPAPELVDLGVAQAGRGYAPGEITHHRASWWGGSRRWGTPSWPRPLAHGWLHSPGRDLPSAGRPLVVKGPFADVQTLRVRIGEVFKSATLVARADSREVFRREFTTGPKGKGPWKVSTFQKRWNTYQCDYDRSYDVTIPAGTQVLEFVLEKGTWLQVTRLTSVRPQGRDAVIDLNSRWGSMASELQFDAAANRWIAPVMQDRQWLWDEAVQPWVELTKQGVGVMIGEFGVYNKTPHDVTLAFLEDCLKNYKKAGFGWALWNFDGSFGILDSGRADVDYEDFHGHKLDRKMLDLLQRY